MSNLKKFPRLVLIQAVIVFGGFTITSSTNLAVNYVAKVQADNGEVNDLFASSSAMNDNYLIVGAPYEDGSSNSYSDSGAVYVYEKSGGRWIQTAYLKQPATIYSNSYFGKSVALDGDQILVGAPGSGGVQSAYLFKKNQNTGNWDYAFLINVGTTIINFGWDVALKGDKLVVSDGSDLYFFQFINGSWVYKQKLDNNVGYDISLDSDFLVAGNPNANDNRGIVFIWKYINGLWLEDTVYSNSSDYFESRFGESVDLQNGQLLVGSPGFGMCFLGSSCESPEAIKIIDIGKVYLYENKNGTWNYTDSYSPTDIEIIQGGITSNNVEFGKTVKIFNSTTALVSSNKKFNSNENLPSNSGAVSILQLNAEGNLNLIKTIKSPNSATENNFGSTLSNSSNYFSVGEDGYNRDQGQAHFYTIVQ